jgi:hypothetical protein
MTPKPRLRSERKSLASAFAIKIRQPSPPSVKVRCRRFGVGCVDDSVGCCGADADNAIAALVQSHAAPTSKVLATDLRGTVGKHGRKDPRKVLEEIQYVGFPDLSAGNVRIEAFEMPLYNSTNVCV